MRADLSKGEWFATALTQDEKRIALSTGGQSNAPLDAMTTWRLVRSLEPAAVEVELVNRTKSAKGAKIILHGWRRRFTDPVSGVISTAYQAGELTQSLCSPWTHDFRDCACIYWASNHPDVVHVDDPDDPTMSGGESTNPKLALMRVDWLRSDRSLAKAVPARATEDANRNAEMDHYEINQRWQELDIVLGDQEILGVYQPRVPDSAVPFPDPRGWLQELPNWRPSSISSSWSTCMLFIRSGPRPRFPLVHWPNPCETMSNSSGITCSWWRSTKCSICGWPTSCFGSWRTQV